MPHVISYTEEIEEHGYCQQRPALKTGEKVQGVKKQGYQLVDADATRKAYQFFRKPFIS